MTPKDFTDLLELQGHACPACLRPFRQGRGPQIDHAHGDGALRGCLCARENYDLLGRFGEDPAFYERVAAYLREPPAARLAGPPRRHTDAPPAH
jgi:hypothetical protein